MATGTTSMVTQRIQRGIHAVPRPWAHNPSEWKHRVAIAIPAAIATVIATYMALYQWGLIDGVWDPVFGNQSERVLDSDVSHAIRRWVLIPDAALGALAYLGDIVLGLAGSTRRWQYRPWLVVFFGLDVIPLGIASAILVVMQGAVVGAWCLLCLVTALLSLLLVVLAHDEVWSCLLYLHGVWLETGDWREVWTVFWGAPSAVGYRVGEQMAGGAN